MTGWTVALVGLGLGLRHATDADHLVVVSGLVQREPSAARAALVAALWGAGHTVSFLAVGGVLIASGVAMPEAFDVAAEALVGAMLIAFGLWHLRYASLPGHRPSTSSARPVALGLVHGLAGSAAISLLAITTIESRPLAALYLMLVGVGTVVGMVLVTVALATPLRWSMTGSFQRRRVLLSSSALLSIGLGVLTLFKLV